MAWSSAKTAIVACVGVLVIVGATTVTVTAIHSSAKQPETNPFHDQSKFVSPFTYVHFDTNDSNRVLVGYLGSEYQLSAIGNSSVTDVLDFCRSQYGQAPFGESWAQKRFAEDLVTVLSDMKHPVNSDNTVRLVLIDPQTGQQTTIKNASMTAKNRQAIFQDRTVVNSNILNALQNPAAK